MNQHEIKKNHPLLDESGNLIESGYSKKEILDYDTKQIKAPRFRIKEWDYYFIGNENYGVAITLADNRYMGVSGLIFFDFKNKKKYDYSSFFFFPCGKLNMPNKSMEGKIEYKRKNSYINIDYLDDSIQINAYALDKNQNELLKLNVELYQKNDDRLLIATPFKKRRAFYYNQKINHLLAKGEVNHLGNLYSLDDNYGVLDWGRGVWPYNNVWYWSSSSGVTNDLKKIGFNLGYGFGDTSNASENMIFYDGKGYKIDQVTFNISKDYITEWDILSNDDSLNLKFTPIYDNKTKINYLILGQDAHQVFGIFSGYFNIKGVGKIKVDNLFGFAERVMNRW